MSKSITRREEFDAILEDQSSTFLKFLTEVQLDEFKYAGVDFVKMMNHLISSEPNPKTMVEDMAYLITLTQMRGTNLSKIQTKSGETLVRKLKQLVSKYEIKPHNKELPMTQPSLPRLMSLFPEQIYIFRKDKKPDVQGALGSLPVELAWPGGMAMIREDDKPTQVAYLEWYKSFCEVVKINFDPANAEIALKNSPVSEVRRHKASGIVKSLVPPKAATVLPPPPKSKAAIKLDETDQLDEAIKLVMTKVPITEETFYLAMGGFVDYLSSNGWDLEVAKVATSKLQSTYNHSTGTGDLTSLE